MIQLTRLRHDTPFYLNPDLIERIDSHVDTVVRLTNGTEYVVNESGDEIVRRTADFRARVIALAGIVEAAMGDEVREQAAAMAVLHANPSSIPARPALAVSPPAGPDTDDTDDTDTDETDTDEIDSRPDDAATGAVDAAVDVGDDVDAAAMEATP